MSPDTCVTVVAAIWILAGSSYLLYSWRRIAWALLEVFMLLFVVAPLFSVVASSMIGAAAKRASETGDYGELIKLMSITAGIPIVATTLFCILFGVQLKKRQKRDLIGET